MMMTNLTPYFNTFLIVVLVFIDGEIAPISVPQI